MSIKNIADILTDLVPKKGKNKSEVARRLGISSQLLGQYMNDRHKPKLDFYQAWEREFGEDLKGMTERNVSDKHPPNYNPPQSLIFSREELVTLFRQISEAADEKIVKAREDTDKARRDNEKILKEHNTYLQDLVKSSLTNIEKWSFATLVDVQATQRYQAKKESGGNEATEKAILAEQGKIAGDLRKIHLKARKTSAADNSSKP